MRRDMIAGNWKMHATHLDAIQMVQKLSYRLDYPDYERVEVVVCPPFTALRSAQTVIETDHIPIKLGAQDTHWEEQGAFTGEVSPAMLAKLSVSYVLAGHSERRTLFGEDDATVNKKVRAIVAHEMSPVLCVGETLEEREADATESRVESQVTAGFKGLDASAVAAAAVAYEPIWAIGTGRSADPDDAGKVISYIRSVIADGWGAASEDIRILYGGSVNAGNISGFMAKRDIDGALVGGASLDPDAFASIIRYWV